MMHDGLAGRRVTRRLARIRRVFLHLILTIVFALSMSWAIEQPGVSPALENLIPAAVLLFIAHALWVTYQESSQFIEQQELQRADADDEFEEKPKRVMHLELDEEGDLVYVPGDDTEEKKLKRSG